MATRSAAPAAAAGMGKISFKLDTFTAGAGLAEGTYQLVDNKVVTWDYDGKIAQPVLALMVTAQPVTINKDGTVASAGEPISQHYSIGDAAAFAPDETGYGVVAVGNRTSLGKGSNFYIWLENLINAGFPEDQYDNDLSVFNGAVVHITNIPAPTRNLPQSNLVQQNPAQAPRERTLAVVNDIYKLPWEPKARVAGAAPAAKQAAAPPRSTAPAPAASGSAPAKAGRAPAAAPAGTGAEPSDILAEHMTAVLNGQPSMSRVQARVGVFKAMNSTGVPAAQRDAAIALFNDDNALGAVLAGIGNGYVIDGANIVSLG